MLHKEGAGDNHMNNDVVKLSQAAAYAAQQHVGQRRKGDRAEPYVNHVIEVAAMLAAATEGGDAVLVMGGLLHDTIEDTGTKAEELVELFGAEVAALVQDPVSGLAAAALAALTVLLVGLSGSAELRNALRR